MLPRSYTVQWRDDAHIVNAKLDPTFLMADVEIVATYDVMILPKELEGVREAAKRAIIPLKPADANSRADPKFLFTAHRTPHRREARFAPLLSGLFPVGRSPGFPELRPV
jgi:hypothetical protein